MPQCDSGDGVHRGGGTEGTLEVKKRLNSKEKYIREFFRERSERREFGLQGWERSGEIEQTPEGQLYVCM